MLGPIEVWSSTIVQKPELKIHFNKGCWLRTITKNNKESYSDIWIPNLNLLMKKGKRFIQKLVIQKKQWNHL
jgi:hypothetical protein